MRESLETKLSRIRETDAFLAVRLEIFLALSGLFTVAALALFLWYAIIRGRELWMIALVSTMLGLAVGIPIGRFFMPLVVEYVRGLGTRLEVTESHITGHYSHSDGR
jgi:predicted membrane-bound spermidine synthase